MGSPNSAAIGLGVLVLPVGDEEASGLGSTRIPENSYPIWTLPDGDDAGVPMTFVIAGVPLRIAGIGRDS
jgi:hypothetical protein